MPARILIKVLSKNMRTFFNKRATAVIEYTALLVIIMLVFLSFQKYVIRGFAGRWKEAGDAFGYGRQYDPVKTTECVWSEPYQNWYVPGEYKTTFESYYPGCLA